MIPNLPKLTAKYGSSLHKIRPYGQAVNGRFGRSNSKKALHFDKLLLNAAIMPAQQASRVRLFQSDFFEWFSKVHPATPFVLFAPTVVIALIFAAKRGDLTGTAMIVSFLCGLLSWTLTEYLLHRFVFHYQPKSAVGQRIAYIMHGVHHDDPHDHFRLVMPPIISLCVGLFVYSIGFLFAGYDSLCFVAGWVVGYIYYDLTHFAIHRRKGFRGFGFQRRNHLIHHFKDSKRCFGVTSPLWDHIFRTQIQGVAV